MTVGGRIPSRDLTSEDSKSRLVATEGAVLSYVNLRSKSASRLHVLNILPMIFCRKGHSWVAIDKFRSARLCSDYESSRCSCMKLGCNFILSGQFQWNRG